MKLLEVGVGVGGNTFDLNALVDALVLIGVDVMIPAVLGGFVNRDSEVGRW